MDPEKLLPRATVIVHIDQNTLAEADGVARIEGVGPVMAEHLEELLGHSRITLLPIVDSRAIVPSDAYEIGRRTRLVVMDRNPIEVFPGSRRPASRCDLDHTQPFQWDTTTPPSHSGPGTETGAGGEPLELKAGRRSEANGPIDRQPRAGRSRPPGQTRPDNLGPLSRTVHRAKTHGGWQVKQLFEGIFVWQSPDGFTHLVTPTRSWLLHAPELTAA